MEKIHFATAHRYFGIAGKDYYHGRYDVPTPWEKGKPINNPVVRFLFKVALVVLMAFFVIAGAVTSVAIALAGVVVKPFRNRGFEWHRDTLAWTQVAARR